MKIQLNGIAGGVGGNPEGPTGCVIPSAASKHRGFRPEEEEEEEEGRRRVYLKLTQEERKVYYSQRSIHAARWCRF